MLPANPVVDIDAAPCRPSLPAECSMRRQLLGDVEHRFAKVERVETVAVERLGRRVMDADIFVCRHYLGPESSMHR